MILVNLDITGFTDFSGFPGFLDFIGFLGFTGLAGIGFITFPGSITANEKIGEKRNKKEKKCITCFAAGKNREAVMRYLDY